MIVLDYDYYLDHMESWYKEGPVLQEIALNLSYLESVKEGAGVILITATKRGLLFNSNLSVSLRCL